VERLYDFNAPLIAAKNLKGSKICVEDKSKDENNCKYTGKIGNRAYARTEQTGSL
jgi:hypothetical protein